MKAGSTAHRQWQCPKCGRKHIQGPNDPPAFAVECGGPHPKERDPFARVAMKPLDPPVDRSPRRKKKAA